MKKNIIIAFALGLVTGTTLWAIFQIGNQSSVTPSQYSRGEQTETKLGFIQNIETSENGTQVTFNEAVWHSGDEAIEAAIQAGVCTEETRDSCTPNDYFIEIIDAPVLTYMLNSDTRVVMMTYRDDINTPLTPNEIPATDFMYLLQNGESVWSQLPYRITIFGTQIANVEEVYVT